MMAFSQEGLLALAAVAAGGAAGLAFGLGAARRGRFAAVRRKLRSGLGAQERRAEGGAMPASRALRYAMRVSHRLALRATTPLVRKALGAALRRSYLAHARKAGMEGEISSAGFVEASARLGLGGACAGLLLGLVFSTELALIGLGAGALWGLAALPRALRRAERERADGLGRDLAQMLEVVALGLRSGLAFDRSFALYGAHFDTSLARECAAAARSWSIGLSDRAEALRCLAASYDSALLERVVENMVRSLRFGSSMAESLETAACEARAVHRSRVEERVAKAPVKMMVPTGTLILPAMLLLVLGPVLLELMEGF